MNSIIEKITLNYLKELISSYLKTIYYENRQIDNRYKINLTTKNIYTNIELYYLLLNKNYIELSTEKKEKMQREIKNKIRDYVMGITKLNDLCEYIYEILNEYNQPKHNHIKLFAAARNRHLLFKTKK